jgi:hypothetical protein
MIFTFDPPWGHIQNSDLSSGRLQYINKMGIFWPICEMVN